MKFFFALILFSSTAFASEKEINYCDSYRSQRDQIYKDISKLSAEMAKYSGPETVAPDVRESTNCEDVPSDYSILSKRREYLEKRLAEVNGEIRNYCPGSRPE
jgi:hypothetical protein